MRDRLYLVLIPIGALLALLPLLLKGPSCGHDFGFHVINWLEVGSQWKQGVLIPHWAFTPAGNAGEPRFVFYPPLSWAIGALAGFVLPWAAVPNAFVWLGLTACGFTMHRLAKEWTSEGTALIAACVFMVHPYMLFTFYERSAFAELLAAAWIPLVLLALLRRRLSISGIAVPVALLWLTNDPAAVMGCYLLALLGIFRITWIWRNRKSPRDVFNESARIAIGAVLGLTLAGFYLVPAIVEQRWVRITMESVKGVRIQDNFLFGQFGGPSHKAILLTASLCGVTLLAVIAIFAIIAASNGTEDRSRAEIGYRKFVIVSLSLAALVAGFLLTAPSAFVWRHTPELKYLQFPWRFDAILGALAAALLALALDRIRVQFAAAVAMSLAVPLLFSVCGSMLFRQVCNGGNDVASLVASFYRSQVLYSDEYTPAGSDPQMLGHSNPNAWVAESPDGQPPPHAPVSHSISLSDRLHIYVSSPAPAFFIVNLRDYPAWRITVNGIPEMKRPHRADGLIVAPIPKGSSRVDIRYAVTPDQIVGWVLTAFTLALLFVWLAARKTRERELSI
jgi:uncharacterized membrane protein